MVQYILTLNLLTTTIVAPPSNASKWQMGFNSAFKGLIHSQTDTAVLKFGFCVVGFYLENVADVFIGYIRYSYI